MRRSTKRPPILSGDSSAPVKLKSRNVSGYPTVIEMFSLPEINELNGNWKMDKRSTKMKIVPKMAPNLFVGISCFGNALPMTLARLSLPTYLYSGFLVRIALFCMDKTGDLALYNFFSICVNC